MAKKKRIAAVGAGVLAAGALFAGMMFAYQTDLEAGINKVVTGDVHINAWEPNWPTEDTNNNGVPDEAELVIPYETLTKDPRIQNTGTNDAIVFFKVTAPVEELTLISDDGKRGDPALTDLFWFKQDGDADTLHENNFNDNWIRLTALDGQIVDCSDVNEEGKGLTYIFGYHTRLTTRDITTTLFDKIQNKKYGSKTIGPNEVETIKLEAYAIQADDVLRSGIEVPTDGSLSEQDLTYLYQAFFNQNSGNLKTGGGNG